MRTELIWMHEDKLYCLVEDVRSERKLFPTELTEQAQEAVAILDLLHIPWMFYREGYCSLSNANSLPERFGNAKNFLKQKRVEIRELVG